MAQINLMLEPVERRRYTWTLDAVLATNTSTEQTLVVLNSDVYDITLYLNGEYPEVTVSEFGSIMRDEADAAIDAAAAASTATQYEGSSDGDSSVTGDDDSGHLFGLDPQWIEDVKALARHDPVEAGFKWIERCEDEHDQEAWFVGRLNNRDRREWDDHLDPRPAPAAPVLPEAEQRPVGVGRAQHDQPRVVMVLQANPLAGQGEVHFIPVADTIANRHQHARQTHAQLLVGIRQAEDALALAFNDLQARRRAAARIWDTIMQLEAQMREGQRPGARVWSW